MIYYLISNVLNQTSAVFCVKGPDANTYLQGQFTQDLAISKGKVAYGLFLNLKGKVISDAYILRLEAEEFMLVSFSAVAPKLRERLEAYLIADDVNIVDETGLWSRISVWGDEASAALDKLTGSVPAPGAWTEGRNLLAFRSRRGVDDCFEVLVPRADVFTVEEALQALNACAVDAAMAERSRIMSGIPAVPADIGSNDLPNEGGLDEVAISYTKGCYLGQEVMARLKNLGQVRRRLHLVRGPGAPPPSGAPLFQSEKRVGELRSVASDGDGFVALAMLSLVNFLPDGALSLASAGPADVTVIRRV